MSGYQVFHPEGGRQVAARNRLLQKALRPEPSPFAIEREYPLVLGERGKGFSYCLGAGEDMVAHANLWPRTLITGTGAEVKVGLVGNVATDERYRGQGVMRSLLLELKQEAERLGLKALVLWSDLLEFYQKVGFQSFGHERRWRFSATDLRAKGVTPGSFCRVTAKVAPDLAGGMLAARYPVGGTLIRSVEEFRALLAIPALDVFVARTAGIVDGYALLGKGCDMVGVIHEWGTRSPRELLQCAAAAAATGFEEVMVLAPAEMPEAWTAELTKFAIGGEPHAMGLAWTDDAATRQQLDGAFIWGLDSI